MYTSSTMIGLFPLRARSAQHKYHPQAQPRDFKATDDKQQNPARQRFWKHRRRAGDDWEHASDYPISPGRQITMQSLFMGEQARLRSSGDAGLSRWNRLIDSH